MSPASNSSAPLVEIAVAVVEHDQKYLIGLRPEGATLAGFWEFPGGKVDPGETAEAAAARECLEETGLTVRVTGEYPSSSHGYAQGGVQIRFFSCAPFDQGSPLPSRFRWVTRSQLSEYRFPPANDQLLARLTLASGRQEG